jgi:hypothetical protein
MSIERTRPIRLRSRERGVTHPDFGFSGPGGASDPHDLAVVLLDVAPGIAPAQLPTEGLLDELAHNALPSATFTAVGYGTVREEKTGGPHGVLPIDGVRRFALQTFRSFSPPGSLCRNNRRPATPAPAAVIPGDLISWAARPATYWCRSR